MPSSRLSRTCHRRNFAVNFEPYQAVRVGPPRGVALGQPDPAGWMCSRYGQLTPARSAPDDARPSVPWPHAFAARTR